MSETTPDETIHALRTLQDHVAEVAASLDDAALARPSGSSEWTVAHVLSHLGSGSEINVGTVEAAVDGRPSPGLDANQPIWDRWDALDPRAQRDGFLEWGERLVSRYEAMSPEQREQVRFDLPFLPESVGVVVAGGLRLNELLLHGWDVDVAFAADAHLVHAGVPLVLRSIGPLLQFAGKAEALAARPVLVRAELTHPADVLGVAIGEQTVGFVDEVPAVGDADVLLHASSEAFLRLVTGRLAPRHTPATVHVEGPVSLDQLRAVFPGY